MLKHRTLFMAVILSLPFAAANAQTSSTTFPKVDQQTEGVSPRPHVGLTLGSMNPDNSYGAAFEYGVDAGFQPMVPLGVGIEISQVNTDRAEGLRNESLSRTSILPRVTYNLGGNIPVIKHTYMGLGAGAIIDAKSPHTGTHLGIAPLAGFDIPLVENPKSDYMSLGLGAKYVFVSGPSPDAVTVNGQVKYWF